MNAKDLTDKDPTPVEEENQKGMVVATQWPTEVKFSESEISAKATVEKYAHLKQLNPESKEDYAELKEAISDVKKTRVDVGKEEADKKEPLNKYLKLILATSKKIREIYSTEETRLRAEKKRIDDIRTEKKLEQQRLWQTNLGSISLLTASITELTQSDLVNLLDNLNEYDFEALDFGDFIDQAKTAVATAVNVVTERIEFMKEQKRLADEKLWQGNLNTVNNWATCLETISDKSLQVIIEELEKFEFGMGMKFGDLLEDAKKGVLAALNRALNEDKRRSDRKAEEAQRAAEKKIRDAEALALVQENNKRIARENDEKKKRDDEKALSDKKAMDDAEEMQRMRDQIAAMKKAAEPNPEKEPVVIGVDVADGPGTSETMNVVSQGEVTMVEESLLPDDDKPSAFVGGSSGGSSRADAIKQDPESTVDRDRETMAGGYVTDDDEEENISLDSDYLLRYAEDINTARRSLSYDIKNKAAINAANNAFKQLEEIVNYLVSTAESLR